MKTILVAPLNWGLGHATRCIPIIRKLHQAGIKVILASDGRASQLLQQEFPNMLSIQLPSYGITYSRKSFVLDLLLQLPKIGWAIIREYFRLRRLVRQYNIDSIISDNRYGCFHLQCPSFFITHQVNIMVPHQPLQFLVRWLNQTYIHLFFTTCWIPDTPNVPRLAGKLSERARLKNVEYIGILSRFKAQQLAYRYDLIAILSGPEPQRTKLEESIIAQLENTPIKALIVGGKTERLYHQSLSPNLSYVSFMTADELNEAICQSQFVVSRSGYSTLMDLAQLQKAALLVPTPGQTEQEYLALHNQGKLQFLVQEQADLNIAAALTAKPTLKNTSISKVEEGLLQQALVKGGLIPTQSEKSLDNLS